MRTLIALTFTAALVQLGGCALDGVEASQVRPVQRDTEVSQPAGGHEIHKMFAEEKARAKQSELPAQF